MLPSERAFAQGTTHAGSRSAAALTPVIVVALVSASSLSWRLPFLLFAGVGLVWAVGWYAFYRNSPSEHRRVNAAENGAITAALHGGDVLRRGVISCGPCFLPSARMLHDEEKAEEKKEEEKAE